ncbi:hypothetical protein BGZ76_002237 [Entomortierella beljakovae]|nr:hypothetical protein BGZ76_002237 [Entomortierella beljakovae]
MASEIELFCIVDGDSELFSVVIPTDKKVEDLKKAIKKELNLGDITNNRLTIWQCSLASEPYRQIAVKQLNNNEKELLVSTRKISEVFGASPPENSIHIIVQCQDIQETHDTRVAELEKQIADHSDMYNSDSQFDITLKIEKTTILWTANTSTASLLNLIRLLKRHSIYHDQIKEFMEVYSFNPPKAGYETIVTDEQLRTVLRVSRLRHNSKLILSLMPPSKCFSKRTFDEVCSEYELSTRVRPSIMDIPNFEGVEASPLDTAERIRKRDRLIEALKIKEGAYRDPKENEATRLYFVESYLSCAIALFKDDMQLRSQTEVVDRRGYGPVDFSVHSTRLFDAKEFTLGVTEIKHTSFEQGFAQNIIQLESTLTEVKKRKTIDLDIDEDGQLDIDDSSSSISTEEVRCRERLRNYGIVTDSKDWYFLECTMHENSSVTYKKALVSDVPFANADDRAELIFRKIIWLCTLMQKE